MKLITNQDSLLLNDLADKIVAGVSHLSISVDYLTAPALADGLENLKRCQSIRILLGNAPEWPGHHFLSSEGESLRSRNLDQRYRLQQVASSGNCEANSIIFIYCILAPLKIQHISLTDGQYLFVLMGYQIKIQNQWHKTFAFSFLFAL